MPKRHDQRGRSTNPDGQFISLPYNLVRSPAFRDLSGAAIKVLLELSTKFYGINNGDLSLSMDHAARDLHISKATASRAFAELEEHGFIKTNKKGVWIKGKATTYRLTTKPCGSHPRTDDWKQWSGPARKRKRKPWSHRKREVALLISDVTKNISRYSNETE